MVKTISAMEARHNFGQVMNEISLRGDEYVVERAGKPLVVMMSVDKYEQLQQMKVQTANAFFDTVGKIQKQNKNIKAQTLEKEVEEALRTVRLANRTKAVTTGR